ncbi:RES family NAD+ phosphorylase [Flavobacterium sp. HSC-61S13]|uniref:RES family NAD+ phosphorylase n=1 Tax=Flavobacterium sp. HSC-61S13 TaxID=2910963 RepID=UPI00209E0479|nr:RES family NAD+ phosphorylase [Flavobacterium sp. HSC-61S13]MCP1994632.1 RES domain-containing protein [Flavobacterium sp. HSC-61S13]
MPGLEETKNFDFFEDEFLAEVDKWLTADIKCCSECLDDFISKWPIVIDRLSKAFSQDIHSFYELSRMNLLYTKSEYLENLYRISCPRCSCPIDNSFWAFEFEFSVYDEIEFEFEILKQQIRETPYMALKNELALKVYEILEYISTKTNFIKLDFPLFRGRIIEKEEYSNSDFLAPPPNSTNEGRYNHLGIPVIYCADTKNTCFTELRKPEQNLYIAKFEIKKELKLLDLNSVGDFLEWDKDNLLNAIVLSSIMSSKTNDDSKYKPEYYFTRFISDCCKSLNYDGIIYPSVQTGEGKNYILFDTKLLDEKMIEEISKYR